MKLAGRAALLVLALAGSAFADDVEDRFHAAERRAAAGELDALEAFGRERPITRWTDDAWAVAARFAEQARDFERAQRDLEQVIATSSDETALRRARNDLERIRAFAGSAGQWNATAAAHEELVAKLTGERGDPRGILGQLEALVRDNPAYPRAPIVMIAIAHGWEREGEVERAASWLRRARDVGTGIDRERAAADLARLYIRERDIAEAEAALAALDDRRLAAKLRIDLASAKWRTHLRWALWALLAVLAGLAAFGLRRGSGSWRAALRRLAKPPAEVIFFAPIAAVIVAVAYTGNPLVARAVLAISLVGVAVGWISGALLEGRRATLPRTLLHVLAVAVAIVAASYLAIDRDRMIDLLIETWRSGPAAR
ncbi:MAG: hypothetical protein HOV81_30875 [Kofleriaceae bacterium]|nr:hypothetical protein [Kofleriaceae bacterium]